MNPALLRQLQHQLDERKRARQRRAAKRLRRRATFRPAIDPLEARHLLTTFTVLDGGDPGDSLREVIQLANEQPGEDVIEFASSIDSIDVNGQILITDDLIIRGPGADNLTISGNGDRVFGILPSQYVQDIPGLNQPPSPSHLAEAPTVRFEGLSIEDGLALNALGFDLSAPFSFGGGIYNMGGTVTLDNVHMSNNMALGAITAGGAIANEFGGTLIVNRSQFSANSSQGFLTAVGGAITSDLGPTFDPETGEAGTTGQPIVQINRSSFVGNTAQAASGYVDDPMFAFSGVAGGGAVLNVTGQMTISRSHFEDNSVIGGAAVKDSDTIPDSTTGGGGIGGAVLSGDLSPFGLAESSLRVSRSTFKHNSATGGSGATAGVAGGLASGGAIAVGNGSDARLERNSFYENSVSGGAGGGGAEGGIGTGGAVLAADAATLRLQRNRFVKNEAEGGDGSGTNNGGTGRGGALGLDTIQQFGFGKTTFPDGSMPFDGPATATSQFDVFYRNTAKGGIGGGIYNDGDLSILGSRLVSNKAQGSSDVAIDFVPGYTFLGAALGGGVSNIGSLEVKNATFALNEAEGADNTSGANFLSDGFANYAGLGVGGGLHNIGQASVKNSHFTGNGALGGDGNEGSFAGVGNGGGIYNDGALTFLNGTVRDNVAKGGDGNSGDLNAGGGYGGGIVSGSVAFLSGVRDASVQVERSSIVGNQAVGGTSNVGPETITLPPPAGLTIPTPAAHKPSGGIGGGILVYQGTASISKTDIVGNRAEGNDAGFAAGGGVFFFGFVGFVNADLSQSTVAHNTAIAGGTGNALGAGIAIGSLGSIFSAGFLSGNPGATNVFVSVDRTDVSYNDALGGEGGNGLGGGIFNGYDAETSLERSRVKKNKAIGGPGGSGIGGGIYNELYGDFHEERSQIFANWASTRYDDCFNCRAVSDFL